MNDRPIAVGVDGSPASVRAARWAAATAEQRNRPLRLVTAFDWQLGAYIASARHVVPDMDEIMASARELLAEVTVVLRRDHPNLRISDAFVAGVPKDVLVAESRDAEMTVLGRRGLGGMASLLLGSVSTQVTTRGYGPIVVIPDRAESRGPIVVGVDDSPVGSQETLAFAFEEANWRDAELVAVHAWTPPGAADLYGRDLGTDAPPAPAETELRQLAEALAGWREKYPDLVVRAELAAASPSDALVTHGRDARLIVVGAHTRSTVAGVLLGSVSRAVLHRAIGPVAVVRPRQQGGGNGEGTSG